MESTLRRSSALLARLQTWLIGACAWAPVVGLLLHALPAAAQHAGTAVAASESVTGGMGVPRLSRHDGRFALEVDGTPFFMFGAQINNSSSWPETLPAVWSAMAALHANTVEAPVYWETMEAQPGHFDFSTVDMLVQGARAHHLHLVLLWFGTWKNGQNHYVPVWMKRDTVHYPREISAAGKLLDVMSPHAAANQEADARAFAALLGHVRQIDGSQHTVVMVQVENESGAIGTVRDHSPAADREFAGQVPAELHTRHGTWTEVYGVEAEERFAAYATARYINAVAAAGKAAYPLPMYCNIWITYPVHALANRDRPSPGQEYPSGGPQQGNVAIWKAAAPSIDVLGFDWYSGDRELFRDTVGVYARADNPLFIPETHLSRDTGPNLFYALGHGAIGFSPFGVDFTQWTWHGETLPADLTADYRLLEPMAQELASLNLQGALQTAVELPGAASTRLHFGDVDAVVRFGFPQRDGEAPLGTEHQTGRALVARLGPNRFLVTGLDASVLFEPPAGVANRQVEFLTVEQGGFHEGTWQTQRLWNGDQTDRGLQFHADDQYVVETEIQVLPEVPARH